MKKVCSRDEKALSWACIRLKSIVVCLEVKGLVGEKAISDVHFGDSSLCFDLRMFLKDQP